MEYWSIAKKMSNLRRHSITPTLRNHLKLNSLPKDHLVLVHRPMILRVCQIVDSVSSSDNIQVWFKYLKFIKFSVEMVDRCSVACQSVAGLGRWDRMTATARDTEGAGTRLRQ
jgi:hypothetical protein